MRGRDPLTLALMLMALYALVVGAALTVALRDSPGTVASQLRGDDEAAAALLPSATTVCFDIEAGAGGDEIALDLAAAGVIASEQQFKLVLEYTGGGANLRAGRYELQRSLPVTEVIRRLRDGDTNEDLLRVPEGMRLEELGEWLAAQDIGSIEGWDDAISGARPEAILVARPDGASLLGYLLPASYPLGCGAPPTLEELVTAMLDAFSGRLDGAVLAAIEAGGRSLHEVLTLASIIEKEAVQPEELPLIASVLLNRLALGIALQADPTVQFAVASANAGERGWWPEIFEEDLKLDSPYNTYLYPGLPPGPIANPGIGAVLAVLSPAETDYLYFVARCDGSERHDFAATLEEHNTNVARCHGG